MQDAAAGYGPLPPGSTWIRRLYRRFCRWTAQANLQPLSNPRLEAFRYLGLKFGQDAADLIEDNRKLEDRNPCCLSGEISPFRSEEHTSELQSLMRISYAVFCLKKKKLT